MGGEDALVCPVWGKVMLVERACGAVVYAGGNGMGVLCCSYSLLESSEDLCWQTVSSGVSRALPQAPLAPNS